MEPSDDNPKVLGEVDFFSNRNKSSAHEIDEEVKTHINVSAKKEKSDNQPAPQSNLDVNASSFISFHFIQNSHFPVVCLL